MSFHVYSYGALALVCAGLYAWALIEGKTVESVKAKLETKQTELDQAKLDLAAAVQVNANNLTQIGILKADLQYQSDLAVKYDALARSRDRRLTSVLKGISDAPASDDGPVAGVLEQLLDGMRERHAAAAGHNQDPDRAAEAPGQ